MVCLQPFDPIQPSSLHLGYLSFLLVYSLIWPSRRLLFGSHSGLLLWDTADEESTSGKAPHGLPRKYIFADLMEKLLIKKYKLYFGLSIKDGDCWALGF